MGNNASNAEAAQREIALTTHSPNVWRLSAELSTAIPLVLSRVHNKRSKGNLMKRADPQSESDCTASDADKKREHDDKDTIEASTNRDSAKNNTEKNDGNYTRLVRQSRMQIVTNCLIALFTLLLALISYSTEEPYVAPRVGAITEFGFGHPLKLSIALENLGHTPAYQAIVNIGLAVLPYPLKTILPHDLPAATNIPLTLYSHEPAGIPITTLGTLSREDADAVTDGTKTLLYLWGTIHYEDAFGLPHSNDFCFTYGGPVMNASGVCTINQAQQYILETQPQPHAQPNLIPFTPGPSSPPPL
jgi:hypothetical protein